VNISGEKDYKSFVEEFAPKICSVDDVYGLFKGLGYPPEAILDPSYKRRISEFGFAKEEEEKIANIYTILSIEKNLNVFLVETKSPANVTVRFLRYLAKVFSDHYMHFLLIVTGDFRTVVFVLPDFERKGVGEVKLKIIRLQVDVSDPYYTDKQTIASLGLTEQERSWRDIWLKWRDAFSVRRVTDEFFRLYAGDPDSIFFKVRNSLVRQKISRKDAHEFTLQLLNRIMFVYFVAKKRWLNNDPRFMRWLWQRYLKERNNGRAPVDSFYEKWLKTIFFEAFNNKFTPHADLPDDVNRIFYTVPYLNGGLFREEDVDRLPVKIKDDLFKEVFEFFERYNFTIREDLPFDVEVAVDPQMIGYVYESLANVAEEIYDRNDLGIFYTPRVEVDFMCRRSIVEYLHNHLPKVPKELWYKLVFDEDTEAVEKQLSELNIWYDLEEKLDSISVVDPACGSGAFLVGMLNVLTDLHKIVNRNLGRVKPDFEIKKRIVGKNLYGVDVMPWAVHAAELRLWLQLVVESPLEPKDLRTYPLLPNLNMNLRVGDSLVQEIGGLTLHLRDPKLSEKVRKKLVELKQEKENYINNVPTAKFKTKEEVQKEEIRIFEEIIEEQLQFTENEIKNLRNKIKGEESQKTLSGEKATLCEERRKRIEQLQEQIERYNREEYELKKIKDNLTIPEKKPFVWEIDFAEVFGEKAGFDIVIGNPPYIRHQRISPPNKMKSEVTIKNKREYKDKLISSLKIHAKHLVDIDPKSDYYVYFYFHGLLILNKKGTFCFITSSSWLDAAYGKSLQDFLLKYVPITAIYDNVMKRSFAHAKVNTIIALFQAPCLVPEESPLFMNYNADNTVTGEYPCFKNVAKFVTFKKPFEEVISSVNLWNLEKTMETKNMSAYRIIPKVQRELYIEGLAQKGQREYEGDFWGGKYLRSPDVFFEILQKQKEGKLVELRKIANVETYLNTGGADDFFFVRKIATSGRYAEIQCANYEKTFLIEKNFLQKFICSPRELESIQIPDREFKKSLLAIPAKLDKKNLMRLKVWKYIEFGIKEGFNNVSGRRGKDKWWVLPSQAYSGSEIILPCRIGDSFGVFFNPSRIVAHRFYRINPLNTCDAKKLTLLLNTTLSYLMLELLRNPMMGEGVLDIGKPSIQRILVVNPTMITLETKNFNSFLKRKVKDIFEECGISIKKPIREQEPNPISDRKELDDIVFDAIGLDTNKRREIYWSVCELVKNRLEKAESLKEKKNE
jgi:23S rRNA G2445 N2-methylase RlmL